MVTYEEVYEELKGRTDTDPEIEEELCRRIAEIESDGGVVEDLPKKDWALIWILCVLGTVLPIVVYAFLLGVSG